MVMFMNTKATYAFFLQTAYFASHVQFDAWLINLCNSANPINLRNLVNTLSTSTGKIWPGSALFFVRVSYAGRCSAVWRVACWCDEKCTPYHTVACSEN